MKKIQIILVTVLVALLSSACTNTAPAQVESAFKPHIIQQIAHKEIANRPAISDINKSGKLLYFLVKEGDMVYLKKRDLTTNKEDLVRIFPYSHEIFKLAIAADEQNIAFLAKEDDKFINYITDLGGDRLIKIGESAAKNGDREFSADSFVLKRVGLKHKFLIVSQTGLDCGGSIVSYISTNGTGACGLNTEIIPEEQLLITDSLPGGKAMLATTDYENWEPKKILELPIDELAIKNIELLDEKTVRISTDKEDFDVQFKE